MTPVFPKNVRLFSYRDATYRIYSAIPRIVEREIKKQRDLLETFITKHHGFAKALLPIPPFDNAPEIAGRMQQASRVVSRSATQSAECTETERTGATGVGPMAGVAGAIAQAAVEAALEAGENECMVDNGGDIFVVSKRSVTIGLYIGRHPLSGKLAIAIDPQSTPLAVCSSSSFLGHSLSFGHCDLATVVSPDGALADCAATYACNAIITSDDLRPAAESVASVPGINGICIVKGDRVALAGDFPPLIPLDSPDVAMMVTKNDRSDFPG